MDDKKREELTQEYATQCHRMQTGVAVLVDSDPKSTEPKHLRVGVNSAMVSGGALARLLIRKGIITEQEHLEVLVEEMKAEADRYEERVNKAFGGEGRKINLE